MVSVAVKGVQVQGDSPHFSFGDDEASLIASLISLALTRSRVRVADQLDEGLEGAKRRPRQFCGCD